MTNPLDHLRRLGWLGWLAILAVLLAAMVLLRGLASCGSALLAPSANRSAAAQDERLARAAEEYGKSLDEAVAQVDGRSIFFVPSPPIPPPPPAPVVAETEPPPPPRPTSYGGPAIVAMVNGMVWFADGTRLAEGQSSESGDIRVLRLDMPWHAVLEWKGVEFKVALFERDSTVLGADSSPEPPDAAPPDPTSPSAPPDSPRQDSPTPPTQGSRA